MTYSEPTTNSCSWSTNTSMPGARLLPLVEFYGSLGLPTFPIHSGPRVPPRGSHGHLEATTDPDEFRYLLTRFSPYSTVGLAARMGDELVGGGYAVTLDLDVKNGKDGPATLRHRELPVSDTLTADTRSGGFHHLYASPVPLRTHNNLLSGVDVKGAGGWIAVAPTPGYHWRVDSDGPTRELIQPAMRWLLMACDRARPTNRAHDTGARRELVVCWAHNDTNPSLQITTLADGRKLYHCFGGCTYDQIVASDPELIELTELYTGEGQ